MTSYQFDESEIDPYFSKLSYDELKEVICHFHNKDLTLPKIMEKYNLEKITNVQFLKRLPSVIDHDNLCYRCEEAYIKKYIRRGILGIPYCPVCNEKMYCEVDPYKKLFSNNKFTQNGINPVQLRNVKTIFLTKEEFDKLDIEVKLFLGSFIKTGISKDFTEINGWRLNSNTLVPNVHYLKHLMTKLGAGNNSPYSIDIKIDEQVARKYFMPRKGGGFLIDEQVDLWKKVALNETVEIFYGSLESKGLVTSQSEAIVPILTDLLKLYSVGQVVNLIWQALNCKYDEYLKGMRDKSHTADQVIYTCKNFGEYKWKRGQKVLCFNRPAKFPQSEISKYLFNDVLKIGDVGYKEIPSEMELMKDPNTTKQGDVHTFN